MARDEVCHLSCAVEDRNGDEHFLRKLPAEFHPFLERVNHAADERIRLQCLALLCGGIVMFDGHRFDIGFQSMVLGNLRPAEAFDKNPHRPVRHLHRATDLGNRADLIEVLLGDLILLAVALSDEQYLPIRQHGLLHSGDGAFPADIEMHHHRREHHHAPQRQQGQAYGLFGHILSSLKKGAAPRQRLLIFSCRSFLICSGFRFLIEC